MWPHLRVRPSSTITFNGVVNETRCRQINLSFQQRSTKIESSRNFKEGSHSIQVPTYLLKIRPRRALARRTYIIYLAKYIISTYTVVKMKIGIKQIEYSLEPINYAGQLGQLVPLRKVNREDSRVIVLLGYRYTI